MKNNHKKFKGRNINYFGNRKSYSDISSFHKLQENKNIKNFSKKSVVSLIAKKLLNKEPDLRASELFIKKRALANPLLFIKMHIIGMLKIMRDLPFGLL